MLNDYKKERTLPPHKINVKLVRPNKNVASKIICKLNFCINRKSSLRGNVRRIKIERKDYEVFINKIIDIYRDNEASKNSIEAGHLNSKLRHISVSYHFNNERYIK
ncbi:hypothetical protein U3516DRAFT_733232 [Neocallimastix sp. 'constans']